MDWILCDSKRWAVTLKEKVIKWEGSVYSEELAQCRLGFTGQQTFIQLLLGWNEKVKVKSK